MAEVMLMPAPVEIKEVIVYKYFPSKSIAQKKYVEANKDKIKEIKRNYYLKNRERILEKQKEYNNIKRNQKNINEE